MLEKLFISDKCQSLDLSIQKKFSTVLNIDNNNRNVSWAVNQRIIDFWRLCNTEDCSNDAENRFDHRNKLQFNIYSNRKYLF